jgi:hypothetical protein
MCKQLSTQEELLSHDEMKGVTLTADKLLYLHAIDLCLNAASLEFFGKAQEVNRTRFSFDRYIIGNDLVCGTVHSSSDTFS